MPAVSQKQRAYLNWKFGHAWTKKHHFDNPGKLPLYAHKKKKNPALANLLASKPTRRR